MIPVFHGEVKGGTIHLYKRESWLQRVQSLDGKRVEVIVREHKAKRSDCQNRLYWGVYIPPLAEYCGYTHDEMHEALRRMFLTVEREGFPPTVKSTTQLNTKEFTEYLDKIEMLACENGVHIPNPNEVDLPEAYT